MIILIPCFESLNGSSSVSTQTHLQEKCASCLNNAFAKNDIVMPCYLLRLFFYKALCKLLTYKVEIDQ